HYGLLGRNGSGKSSTFICNMQLPTLPDATDCPSALLRAMAAKLIPGLSFATKIAILQQTVINEDQSTVSLPPGTVPNELLKKSVLQYIIENDSTRNEIQAELDGGTLSCFSILHRR